jgi:hypothetical protein
MRSTLSAPRPHRRERKIVTVLFCDLVGSTAKAERLDPEDMRAMLSPYYARLRAAETLSADGRRAEAAVQLERALVFYRSVGATQYISEGEAVLATG